MKWCPELISTSLRLDKNYTLSRPSSSARVYSHLLKLEIPGRLNAKKEKNNIKFIYDYCLNLVPSLDLAIQLQPSSPRVDSFRARFWLAGQGSEGMFQELDCSCSRLLAFTPDREAKEPPTSVFKTQVSRRSNVLDILIDENSDTSTNLAYVLGDRPHYRVAMSTTPEPHTIFFNFFVSLRQESHPVSTTLRESPLEREALRSLDELDSVLGLIGSLGLLRKVPERLTDVKIRISNGDPVRPQPVSDQLALLRSLDKASSSLLLSYDLERTLSLAVEMTSRLKETLNDADFRAFFADRERDILRRYTDVAEAVAEARARDIFPDPAEDVAARKKRLKENYFLTTFAQEVEEALPIYTRDN